MFYLMATIGLLTYFLGLGTTYLICTLRHGEPRNSIWGDSGWLAGDATKMLVFWPLFLPYQLTLLVVERTVKLAGMLKKQKSPEQSRLPRSGQQLGLYK